MEVNEAKTEVLRANLLNESQGEELCFQAVQAAAEALPVKASRTTEVLQPLSDMDLKCPVHTLMSCSPRVPSGTWGKARTDLAGKPHLLL